jgi:hypothetical protein
VCQQNRKSRREAVRSDPGRARFGAAQNQFIQVAGIADFMADLMEAIGARE